MTATTVRHTDRSDEDLIGAVRDGDDRAFAELWRRHADAARRVASTITRAFDADDLVSEAYLKILAALKDGRGPTGPFRPYLFVTVRNIAVSWSRRRRELDLDDATTVPDPRATDAPILAAIDGELTLRAFRTLPERWQRILWMTEVEGRHPQDIAAELDIKANTVAALGYRAREGLRQAWIQAHIDTATVGSEHRWALEHVGQATRGALSPQNHSRYGAHMAECPNCTVIAAEAADTSARFTSVALPLAVGTLGAVGLGELIAQTTGAGVSSAQAAEIPTPDAAHARRRRNRHRVVLATVGAVLLVVAGATIAGAVTAPHRSDRLADSPSRPDAARPETAPTSAPDRSATPLPNTDVSPAPEVTTAPGSTTPPSAATAPGPSGTQAGASDGSVGAVSIDTVDTGGGAFFPRVTGTASPGASVQLSCRTGSLGTVVADSAGRWSTSDLTGVPSGTTRITATSDDAPSASVSVTVLQPTVSASLSGGQLTVRVAGVAATGYTATWDGTPLDDATTDSSGSATITGPVQSAPGQHTVTVFAHSGSRSGPSTQVVVTQ